MRPLDLLLISLNTMAAYTLLTAGLERRARAVTVRRLVKSEPPRTVLPASSNS